MTQCSHRVNTPSVASASPNGLRRGRLKLALSAGKMWKLKRSTRIYLRSKSSTILPSTVQTNRKGASGKALLIKPLRTCPTANSAKGSYQTGSIHTWWRGKKSKRSKWQCMNRMTRRHGTSSLKKQICHCQSGSTRKETPRWTSNWTELSSQTRKGKGACQLTSRKAEESAIWCRPTKTRADYQSAEWWKR